MTVKELFLQADFSWIAIQQANDDNQLNRKKYCSFEEKLHAKAEFAIKIYSAYLEMMKIEPEISNGEVVWCSQMIGDDILWQDVRMSYKSEIIEKEIYELDLNTKNPLNPSMEEYREQYITEYAFEFEPWEKILGYEVANACLDIYGVNVVASAIFDEMTFFGLDYQGRAEEVQENTADLEKRCEEVEEYLNLKKESGENQNPEAKEFTEPFIPAEEAFKQLREKLGIPEPTREERIESEKRWKKETEINDAEAVKILKRMKKEYTLARIPKAL